MKYHIRIGGVLQRDPTARPAPGFEGMAPFASYESEDEARAALAQAQGAVASWARIDPDRDRAAQKIAEVNAGEVVPCVGGEHYQGLFGRRCDCRRS